MGKLWDKHLEDTAFEVVRQKFAALPALKEILLSTGDAILAEAAPNDAIWGIGLAGSNPCVHDPRRWPGRNVLGNALMKARAFLREQQDADEECDDTKPKQRCKGS